ncbi:hypothetical protein Cgig2_031508 [Carnegiea gigantea]|uniref:Uncharacterized protein n=1 Tax=Carnegiea gigantea TaxID=171969 RepID=A0A9Q1K4M5_9CARY|nr:hypothetical protein Cgig2_031508 [Carnegiea gigantea]
MEDMRIIMISKLAAQALINGRAVGYISPVQCGLPWASKACSTISEAESRELSGRASKLALKHIVFVATSVLLICLFCHSLCCITMNIDSSINVELDELESSYEKSFSITWIHECGRGFILGLPSVLCFRYMLEVRGVSGSVIPAYNHAPSV